MTGTFSLPRIVFWKVGENDGRVIRLYRPIEAEARFKHSDLWGRTPAPWITPIFERRGR